MSQLLTLIWLKWKLLRNSLRTSKAVVNQVASVVGMLAALAFALLLAVGMGFAAYALTQPGAMADLFKESARRNSNVTTAASAEFLFFTIFAFLYLMWATLPLSIGSSKQFDAGRLLMYPISLVKLFAVDFISEITTLQSVFAIPSIIAIAIGAGLGSGNLPRTILAAVPVCVFGIALSKWLSTTIGSLVRRKRARGETILAFVGVVAGLGGALAGQVAPLVFKHAESLTALRWTPPGAAAFLVTRGTNSDAQSYLLILGTLTAYSVVLIVGTYWIARRAALGLGGARRRKDIPVVTENARAYTGWEIPFLSSDLAAVVEKEIRYVLRNAQLRMMSVMPLVLIVVRFLNSKRLGKAMTPGLDATHSFLTYGSGLMASGGVLYVFLLLASLSCNQFAFEEGGMRTLILSPIDRRKILMGKNLALVLVALVFSILLLIVNAIVFRDLTPSVLLFVAVSFVCYSATMSMFGNSFSIRFPKRMQFGKRLNVSGVAGLLLIPIFIALALPPFGAALAGYLTQSLLVEYALLSLYALLAVALYFVVVKYQGRALERREVEILEVVREPSDQ